jgi:ParB family chromosome partitioning protein
MVVVRDVSSKDAFELALIENIQREDLNPIEFAEALSRLLEEHDYTQETLASRVGKDRSTITNAIRLLKLPAKVRTLIIEGKLSEGHGRALLGAKDDSTMLKLSEKVIRGQLSVRQTEALVRAAKSGSADEGADAKGKTPAIRDLEARLRRHYGARCEVRDSKGKGTILMHYSNLDELDRILDKML